MSEPSPCEKTPRILTRSMKKHIQIEEENNESYFMKEGQKRNFLAKKNKQERNKKCHTDLINKTKEECFNEEAVTYVVELPVKEHGRKEVIEAKEKEIIKTWMVYRG